ncbi:hypothetical protein [Xanthomonas phaseoli]|uniref:hypothetical protein n=1 Tax=Xanthomonas phaseoli TaxID=1985254 RepID=UPI001EE63B9E|nr:hypothetical protein [Xanthomonas phaseoli]
MRQVPADVVQSTLAQGHVIEVRTEEVASGRIRYTYNVKLVDKYGHVNVVTAVVGSFHLLIVTTYTDLSDC